MLLALAGLGCFVCFPARSAAQDLTDGVNVGLPLNGVFYGNNFDLVQTQTGSLHVEVPLWSEKGRGPFLYIKFVYDSPGYYMTQVCPPPPGFICRDTWHLGSGNPWKLATAVSYSVTSQVNQDTLCGTTSLVTAYVNIQMTEPDGTKHHFVPDYNQKKFGTCFTPVSSGVLYAEDGSGWMIRVNPNNSNPSVNGFIYDLIRKDGTEIKAVSNGDTTLTDTNGNQISYSAASSTITDTLGRTITIPNLGASTGQQEIDYTDSNGLAQRIVYTTTAASLATNLPCDPGDQCVQVIGTAIAPSQITLPNGLKYSFTPATGYGQLLSATLPTGGQISWTWQIQNLLTAYSQVTSRTVTANGQTAVWNYAYTTGAAFTTTVTDPTVNDSRYTFGTLSTSGCVDCSNLSQLTKTEYFSGSATSGQILKTVTTDYSATFPILPIRQTTTWNQTNEVSKIETDWDSSSANSRTISWRNPINKREYAYGTGTPLVRTTSFNYKHLTDTSYLNANIADRLTSKIVYEADGVTADAKTLYTYDSTALTGTAGVVGHDYSANTPRGNATLIQQWRNTDGALVTTTNFYNDLGNLIQTQDPGLHNTYFDYTDSWVQSTCAPASGTTQAFVTKTTNHLGQITTDKYYSCSSLLASITDANSQATSYQYDAMGRRIQTNFPDTGQVSVSYGSVLPINIVTTRKINATQNLVTTSVLDDLGHVNQSQLNSDPQGTVYTDTTYDALGRVATVSNPYRSGADPTSSPGTTTYTYDALGRKTVETYPDSSATQTAYCGASTLVTDPTGKWRRSRADALGRLVELDEPNAPGATVAATGCPGAGEPIWVTSYSYDALGNLTQIVQNGSQQRSFTYNSLSQLLTSTNPEVGKISYTYNNDGILTSKTDARSITTNYSPVDSPIDALHRVTKISYSNGDPSISMNYDEPNCLGLAQCQNIGHRTSMTDAAGSESWSFDVPDRIHKEQRTTNGITKTATYNLDLAGNITSVVYPTGRTVNYTYDAANRPSTAADAANGITYAAAQATPPTGCPTSGACYTPQGSVYSMAIGTSATFSGLNLNNTFNNRLQPSEIKASSAAGNAMDITYNFVDPVTLKNSGHVFGITNLLNSGRSQSFTYDQVNRITSAGTTATTGSICWGYQYNYDPWGNLLSQAGWAPTYSGCTEPTLAGVIADGNNHISGLTYDASGNTLTDGANSYTWNAESQMKTAAGVTYTYDGDGRRVSKSSGKLYWYGSGGEILAETDAAGNTTNEYVYFGGKRVAMLPAASTPLYYAEDSLGSSRVIVQSNGAVCYDADFYPYGGEVAVTSTCPQNYKFEGKERDTETGNDDFGARYYSNRLGRWLSADWSAVPVPVPYANLTNPQTLNLYAMVTDDPETFADLDGHEDDDGIVGHIVNFVLSAGETYLSDNFFGFFRPNPQSPEGQFGQAVGDFAAQQSGIAEAEAGQAGLATAPETAMVPEVGPEGAAVQALVSEAAIAHGRVTTAIATVNLAKDAAQTASSTKTEGPKAKDAPGVTAGGQATNEHGQKLGPSGKPQVNNVTKNTKEAARNAGNKGSGTIHDAHPRRDRPHFHTKRGDGTKKRDNVHYYYPD